MRSSRRAFFPGSLATAMIFVAPRVRKASMTFSFSRRDAKSLSRALFPLLSVTMTSISPLFCFSLRKLPTISIFFPGKSRVAKRRSNTALYSITSDLGILSERSSKY